MLDALRAGPSDVEWEAALALPAVREALQEGGEPGAVVQQLFETGGEDAAEGMRDIAGEEHVERYLMKEGSEVWIGREGNEDLDHTIDIWLRAAIGGEKNVRGALLDIVEKEVMRMDELESERNTVPNELVDETWSRSDKRIARILETLEKMK